MFAQEFDVYRTELCGNFDDWRQLQPTFTFSSFPCASSIKNYVSVQSKLETPENEDKPRHVSAYSIYFRECLPLMKEQFPTANFGDYSRLVAAKWENLPQQKKVIYQQKAQHLRKELIRCAAKEAVRKIALRQPLKSINNGNMS